MTKTVQQGSGSGIGIESGNRRLITALVAAGASLTTAPAAALELGDVQVSSHLGQPLRASIAYALAPGEQLADYCVSLQAGPGASGLPNVARANTSVANGVILITGTSATREPLMSMRVNIRCPYAPRLTREYMLFLDPAQSVQSATAAAAPDAPVTIAPVAAPSPAPAEPTERRRAVTREPVANSARYRVQPGDSLSMIAQRVDGRVMRLWDAAGLIFEANPHAFIGNDPNKLKAGVWLEIPDLTTPGAVATDARDIDSTARVTQPPAEVAESLAVAPAKAATDESALTPVTEAGPDYAQTVAPAEPAAQQLVPESELAGETEFGSITGPIETGGTDFETAGVAVEGDRRAATADVESISIPDTELAGPETRSSSPNVATATVAPRTTESESSSIIGWILGGVVALIGGLFLLIQRRRRNVILTPIGPVTASPSLDIGEDTEEVETVSDDDVTIEEIVLEEESPTDEHLMLDADLVTGTGLADGTDVDLAQDLSFDTPTSVDFELPEEFSSGDTTVFETDMLPELDTEIASILESDVAAAAETEAGPEDEDDDDDMSVIIDASELLQSDAVPEQSAGDGGRTDVFETADDLELTAEQVAQLEMLEKDYEDELTATQALNKDLERASAALIAGRLEDDPDDEATSEVSSVSVRALDATAQLPVSDGSASDEAEDSVDDNAMTVVIEGVDQTAEMPVADSDETVEMPAKRGSGSN